MTRALVIFIAVMGLALLTIPATSAQTDTPIAVEVTVVLVWPSHTPTPEPTAGPSPTPTPTATATPDLFAEATVEVAPGEYQAVSLEYSTDLGDVAIVVMLAFIAGLLLVDVLLRVKSK